MTTTVTTQTSILSSLYDASASGINWLGANSKAMASSAGELASRIVSAVADFFSSSMQAIGQYLSIAKDSLLAAKDHVAALPRGTQVIAAASLVAVAALGYIAGKRVATPAADLTPSAAVVVDRELAAAANPAAIGPA